MSGVKRGLRALVACACLLAGQRALAPVVANATYTPLPLALLFSDDPLNTQGFGFVALANGHLYLQKMAGLTTGAGQSAAVQAANGTLLQKAFNYCDTAGVECAEPIVLTAEFNLASGLSVPASANGWRGRFNKSFNLRQAAINAPVLVIGDATGATTKGNVDWEGATLNYVNDQTGQTNSVTFLEGSLSFSKIQDLTVSSETLASGQAVHPGYDGWDRGSRTANGFSFTNSYTKITVSGAQASLFRNNLNGTGNYMEDIYWHNGGNIAGAGVLSDTGIYFGGNGRSDDVCMRCNPEHFISNTPIGFQTVNNMAMIGTHVEDVGTPYILFSMTGAQVNFIDTKVLNFRGVTATVGQSSAATANNVQLFRCNYGSQVDVNGLTVQWDGSTTFASTGSSVFAGSAGTESADADVMFRLQNFVLTDVSGLTNAINMNLEPLLPTPISILQKLSSYTYDRLQPSTTGARFTLPASSTAFTLYGAHYGARISEPASMNAANTITLAATRLPSGTIGSSLSVGAGNYVTIHRNGGTYANPTTVVNGTGATINTISSAANDNLYGWGGSQYVAAP